MALDLSQNALDKLAENFLETMIVVKIQGYDYLYGSLDIGEYARVGDDELYISEFDIGGIRVAPESKSLILKDGTTGKLSQQLTPELNISSVTTMNIALLDKDQLFSVEFSPGQVQDDILGRKVEVFLTLQNLAFPEDAARVFSGIVSNISFNGRNGICNLEVSHPEQLKRQKLYPEFQDEIYSVAEYTTHLNMGSGFDWDDYTGDAANRTISVTVDSTSDFIASDPGVTNYYVEINSEKFKIVSIDSSTTMTLLRAQLNTGVDNHSNNDEVKFLHGIDKEMTKIKVKSTDGFVLGEEFVTSYIRINDEVMKVTSVDTSNHVFTVERGFETTKFFHEQEDEVELIYRIEGDPIDLALKTMLSGGDEYWIEDIAVQDFEQHTSDINIQNTFTLSVDPNKEYGLVEGDKITITGASSSGNNVTEAVVLSMGSSFLDTYYVEIDQALTEETESNAKVKFKSKYNVTNSNFGCKITPLEVDVKQYQFIQAKFTTGFPTIDLRTTGDESAKDLIDKELLRPFGMYAISRKGKISVNATLPPIAGLGTKTISIDNVLNASKLQINRSINDRFYNAVAYAYNPDILEDEFRKGFVLKSESSQARIPIGNRPYTIEARGLRDNSGTSSFVQNQAKRINERYRYGSENLQVSVLYNIGLPLDIGDVVILDGESLNVVDTINPGDQFESRIFEIQQKSLDIFKGTVSLTLVDVVYGNLSRYGTFSPASKLKAASSDTLLYIKGSYGNTTVLQEYQKWSNLVNQRVLVRDIDYNNADTTFIRSVDFDGSISIDQISFDPGEDFIIQLPVYTSAKSTDLKYKSIFTYANPRVTATGGTTTTIEVASLDVAKFTKGNIVRIVDNTSSEYGQFSDDIKVDNISGTTITLKKAIGFTVTSGMHVELIGQADGGRPYVYA